MKTKAASGLAGSVLYSAASLPLKSSVCLPSTGDGRNERVVSKKSSMPMVLGVEEVAKMGTNSPARTAFRTPAITSSAESSSPFK